MMKGKIKKSLDSLNILLTLIPSNKAELTLVKIFKFYRIIPIIKNLQLKTSHLKHKTINLVVKNFSQLRINFLIQKITIKFLNPHNILMTFKT